MKKLIYLATMLLALAACKKENSPSDGPSTQKVSVTGITVNPSSLSLTEGETCTITATVSPSDASNKGVIWSSSDGTVATVADGVVTAVKAGTASITAKSDDGGFTATCTVSVSPAAVLVTGITLDPSSLTLDAGTTGTITATVSPADAADKSLEWTSSDESVATVSDGTVTAIAPGTATITAVAKDGSGVKAECEVTVLKTDPAKAVIVAVDLGLSVKWGSVNLGASKPEDYGDYYAWGETEPYYTEGHAYDNPCSSWISGKTGYNWDSYTKFGTYNKSDTPTYGFTKYNGSDKSVLDAEDDAAQEKLGGNWRMPTDKEWTELRTKCTWTWTSDYNGTGVKGRIVTATNGNSIFLPAAGYRDGTSLYVAGSDGHYWSSSLYTDFPFFAQGELFYSADVGKDGGYRCSGLSVRPVSE